MSLPVNQAMPPVVMDGTGAPAIPRRAKNMDVKNTPWNIYQLNFIDIGQEGGDIGHYTSPITNFSYFLAQQLWGLYILIVGFIKLTF